MYPSEQLSILASSHGWLIALIAAEAGCVCVCVFFSNPNLFFFFYVCEYTLLSSPRDGWAMDIKTDKNSGWKCEMTVV